MVLPAVARLWLHLSSCRIGTLTFALVTRSGLRLWSLLPVRPSLRRAGSGSCCCLVATSSVTPVPRHLRASLAVPSTCGRVLQRVLLIFMARCLPAFQAFAVSQISLSFSRLCLDPEPLGLALRAYGLHSYSAGFPRYLFVYAITAVQDLCPQHRMKLTAAWQIDKKWQHAEPGQCRPVIVDAMCGVSSLAARRRSSQQARKEWPSRSSWGSIKDVWGQRAARLTWPP